MCVCLVEAICCCCCCLMVNQLELMSNGTVPDLSGESLTL